MLAIFKREIKSYFTTPIGFVVLFIMFFWGGLNFYSVYAAGYANLTSVFYMLFIASLITIPILTMKLISEDRRSKVDQALYTAPIHISAVVIGKFLASLAMYAISISPVIIYQLVLSTKATLNWAVFVGNLLGLLLIAAAVLAVGLLISSLTESQVIAAIVTMTFSFFILLWDGLMSFAQSRTISVKFFQTILTGLCKAGNWISLASRYTSFQSGTLDISDILFFISFTAVALFITVRVMDKRRWA